MEAIRKFATESPTITKFVRLMLSTAVGFAAKAATENVFDKVIEGAIDASED